MNRDIQEAAMVLRRGGVVAYPTETVYGLGCDPRNKRAMAKIYRIKGREKKKPLLLVASSIAQVGRVARLSGKAKVLAKTYWPGPLTLVLPSKRGRREVAIRISSSPIARELTRVFGFPIVSTSANRSGKNSARSAIGVCRAFRHARIQPDFILDGGMIPKRKPSTVARVRSDGSVEVLREGAIRL